MTPSDRLSLTAGVETFSGELANRLEHPESLARAAKEALLDEGLECVEAGVRHRLCRLERAAAGEHGQARERVLLFHAQQVVRPLDRRAERPLARERIPPSPQEVEAPREPLENLPR